MKEGINILRSSIYKTCACGHYNVSALLLIMSWAKYSEIIIPPL